MEKELERDIQYLSGYVYLNGITRKPSGWRRIDNYSGNKNGFYAEAYYKNERIVIVYRGTDSMIDYLPDVLMWVNWYPTQYKDAKYFYERVITNNKNCKIYIGGHSLGGSLAQMVGSTVKNVETVTFNAFGTEGILNFHPKYPENVKNYGNSRDAVFNLNVNNHVGKVLLIDNEGFRSRNPEPRSLTERKAKAFHSIESMGDISQAKEYTKKPGRGRIESTDFTDFAKSDSNSNYLRPAERLRLRIEREQAQEMIDKKEARKRFDSASVKNYVNKVTNSSEIYTEESIVNMGIRGQRKNKAAIEYQRKTIGIPSDSQAKKAVSSGGLVFVHEYVRGDGIRVHSHYRARPHRS